MVCQWSSNMICVRTMSSLSLHLCLIPPFPIATHERTPLNNGASELSANATLQKYSLCRLWVAQKCKAFSGVATVDSNILAKNSKRQAFASMLCNVNTFQTVVAYRAWTWMSTYAHNTKQQNKKGQACAGCYAITIYAKTRPPIGLWPWMSTAVPVRLCSSELHACSLPLANKNKQTNTHTHTHTQTYTQTNKQWKQHTFAHTRTYTETHNETSNQPIKQTTNLQTHKRNRANKQATNRPHKQINKQTNN
jgi:hypothetical protein